MSEDTNYKFNMKTILSVVIVGACYSVLNFAGLISAQVQQNTIDFSKAVPNAQGMYYSYIFHIYVVLKWFRLNLRLITF